MLLDPILDMLYLTLWCNSTWLISLNYFQLFSSVQKKYLDLKAWSFKKKAEDKDQKYVGMLIRKNQRLQVPIIFTRKAI